MIARMESQGQAPLLSVTITSAFSSFQRLMTFQNGIWFGHDVTHHFNDDPVSISYSSTRKDVPQNRPLQLHATPPQVPPQPAMPAIQPQVREPAGSPEHPPRLPTPPDMATCPLSEQAIMSALQAMAANPDYSDFMRTMEQNWPELRTITLPGFTIQMFLRPLHTRLPRSPRLTFQQINRVTPEMEHLSAAVHLRTPQLLLKMGTGAPSSIQKT